MRYRRVCLEAVTCQLPPHVVTSDDIEQQLQPVYDRLGLPAGRLELMTGIRERRFFDPGTLPGSVSGATVRQLLEQSQFDVHHVRALVHGSVCRDQMEPATATGVHHLAGLPPECYVLDVSNACLGLLNGMLLVANMIELGQIRAGIVVGTETGRSLVEGTIDTLLANPDVTRQHVKREFASLTIGSGSAAFLLCDEKLSRHGRKFLGGFYQADTSQHELCAGGVASEVHGDDRPRMQTDSEALLHAGVKLASNLWPRFLQNMEWSLEDIDKVVTHQVGKAHRKLLLDTLGVEQEKDFPTVEFLGNTGSAALPMALSLGIDAGHLQPEERVALLGIGSGLNSVMLGLQWN